MEKAGDDTRGFFHSPGPNFVGSDNTWRGNLARTRPKQLYRGLLLAALASMVVGFTWFSIPNRYAFEVADQYMIEYPNWRGLPFMLLAVLLSIAAAMFLRREFIGKLGFLVTFGFLVAGFFLMVAGIVWFFTPDVIAAGDAIMIGYPNVRGLPFLGVGAGLWVLAGLRLRRRHLEKSYIPLATGLSLAGLVSLSIADLAFFFLDIGLAVAGVIPQGTLLFRPYPLLPTTALWLVAALTSWPSQNDWRGPPA